MPTNRSIPVTQTTPSRSHKSRFLFSHFFCYSHLFVCWFYFLSRLPHKKRRLSLSYFLLNHSKRIKRVTRNIVTELVQKGRVWTWIQCWEYRSQCHCANKKNIGICVSFFIIFAYLKEALFAWTCKWVKKRRGAKRQEKN